jgi:hypothetical protein
LEAADQRLAQLRRIGLRGRLEFCDDALRIVQRSTQRDFAHPDRRTKAVRVSGLIMHADLAGSAIGDHLPNFAGNCRRIPESWQ